MKVDLRISHVLVNPVNFVAVSRTTIRKTRPKGFIRTFFRIGLQRGKGRGTLPSNVSNQDLSIISGEDQYLEKRQQNHNSSWVKVYTMPITLSQKKGYFKLKHISY